MMKINVTNNIYKLDLKDLISIGYRENNNERSFLFISKVLGKHIEVRPNMCKVIGLLLTSVLFGENEKTRVLINYIKNQEDNEEAIKDVIKLAYKTNEKIIVLGFAETATALGMAVASAIENSYYITTTRENIKDINSIFNFEEEHSHATTHRCYLINHNKLKEANRIILVDDEITTGKSMLNIIKELIKVTKVKKYIILSILDLRNIKYRNLYKDFANENNIEIEVKSLIAGEIYEEDKKVYVNNKEVIIDEIAPVASLNIMSRRGDYLKFTGRFGVDFNEILKIEEESKEIAKIIEKRIGRDKKILVLGHGENIYIPSRIASYLSGDVYFKSTTRSPIHCSKEEGYLINESHLYFHNRDKYYFYNKTKIEDEYDLVLLISEDNLNVKLTNNMLIYKP
ncbi:phosphoribosyltransferase domain-containing protein [Clostridium sp.]|uniref:phosphoribosyltransferase domain-containing protein n=1 Tax=Clostridium sp. TaxID=1506 RepID=UPI0025BBF2AF|nr:phosphoribosyltransferase domain-containing protein [Clostridium sp.]